MPKGKIKTQIAFAEDATAETDSKVSTLNVPKVVTGKIECTFNDDDPNCGKTNMRFVSFMNVTTGDTYWFKYVKAQHDLAIITAHE